MAEDITRILTDLSGKVGQCVNHTLEAKEHIARLDRKQAEINGKFFKHVGENDASFAKIDRRFEKYSTILKVLVGLPVLAMLLLEAYQAFLK